VGGSRRQGSGDGTANGAFLRGAARGKGQIGSVMSTDLSSTAKNEKPKVPDVGEREARGEGVSEPHKKNQPSRQGKRVEEEGTRNLFPASGVPRIEKVNNIYINVLHNGGGVGSHSRIMQRKRGHYREWGLQPALGEEVSGFNNPRVLLDG